MLKKIFTVFCMAAVILFVANGQASAWGKSKLVFIFDSPIGTFSDPEKAHELVEESLAKILGDTLSYEIIPATETEGFVQTYREEHGLITSTGAEEGKGTEVYLKNADFNNICANFDGDYIIYTRVTNTAPQSSSGILTKSKKTNVVLDFRVWSKAKREFLYTKRVTSKGSSTAFYKGSGSASRALVKGLKKGLSAVEKDADKIRAAMK